MAWDPDSLCNTLTPVSRRTRPVGAGLRGDHSCGDGVAYGARTRNLPEPQSDASGPIRAGIGPTDRVLTPY